jgi:hypothetical protein
MNELGFRRSSAASGFASARSTDDRQMKTNGSGLLGQKRPRRASVFPAQAQVAAWARGCARCTAGPQAVFANGPRAADKNWVANVVAGPRAARQTLGLWATTSKERSFF